MELEKLDSFHNIKNPGKRFARSLSEDPNDNNLTFKRIKYNFDLTLQAAGKSLATPFYFRPFQSNTPITFFIPKTIKIDLQSQKSILFSCDSNSFKTNFEKYVSIADLIMGKKNKSMKKSEPKSNSNDKISNVINYFSMDITDFNYISTMTKISRQQIRNLYQKYLSGKNLFKDNRGKTKSLNQDHIQFIQDFYNDNSNFDKTVFDLYEQLTKQFNIQNNAFTFKTLYKYLKELSITYKKITYKNYNANTPKVKNQRYEVALTIMGAHMHSFDFIYIDETSFNLQTWPIKGWAPSGKQPKASRPAKSQNYSAITAMDINGILCVKIIKGGVKGTDFFIFMTELIESQKERFKSKKVILFMDNASIHRSKDYMQKLEKYYNIQYNAPYTPQLNPIEFAFSKIKQIVRSLKSKTETKLVENILHACKSLTEKDAAEFIMHSLKFLDKAVKKEDFF